MREYRILIDPNSQEEIAASGDYVRIKSAPVDLKVEHPDTGGWVNLSNGDDFEFDPFERLKLSHASGMAQYFVIQVAAGKKGSSSRIAGNIQVSNFPAAFNISNLGDISKYYAMSQTWHASGALIAGYTSTIINCASLIDGARPYNTAGVILWDASFYSVNAGTAPTGSQVGFFSDDNFNPLAQDVTAWDHWILTPDTGAVGHYSASLKQPVFLPIGYGLNFFTELASTSSMAQCKFTVLP